MFSPRPEIFFFFLTSNQSCSFSSEDCKLQTELGVGPSSVTFKPAHLTSLLFNSRLLGQKPLTPQRMHYPGYSNLSQDRRQGSKADAHPRSRAEDRPGSVRWALRCARLRSAARTSLAARQSRPGGPPPARAREPAGRFRSHASAAAGQRTPPAAGWSWTAWPAS